MRSIISLKEDQNKKTKRLPFKVLLYIFIILAIFSSAIYLVWNKTASLEPENKDAIRMTITMGGFEPDVIRVKAGETVKINLINPDNSMHSDGGGVHNFLLTMGVKQVNITVAPESQKVFEFTATKPGEYHWYCDSCCGGKENPGMHGLLIVA